MSDPTISQVFLYDMLFVGPGNLTQAVVIGGGPQKVSGGKVQLTWYPTATGTHGIAFDGWDASGNFVSRAGTGASVSQLPKTPGPAGTEPTGGSLTQAGITINGLVHHPNMTYTLSVSAASLPAGSIVYFDDNGGTVNLGQATVTNGVATLSFTPTTLGAHNLTAVYTNATTPPPPDDSVTTTPSGAGQFAGQATFIVTTPVATATPTGTGSANSIPVIGPLLNSLSAGSSH
ncbi:Ig-like domain-containing protein [Nocardia sp. NPDC101769]